MSKVVLPDKEILEEWVEVLKTSDHARFLRKHLPEMDEKWIKEVLGMCSMVSLPYYKDELHHKAAQIFYKNIKNHYLMDGNKRTAVIVLYLVYLINDMTIKIKPMTLRSLARRVASDKLIENPKIKNPEAVISISEIIFSQITRSFS